MDYEIALELPLEIADALRRLAVKAEMSVEDYARLILTRAVRDKVREDSRSNWAARN